MEIRDRKSHQTHKHPLLLSHWLQWLIIQYDHLIPIDLILRPYHATVESLQEKRSFQNLLYQTQGIIVMDNLSLQETIEQKIMQILAIFFCLQKLFLLGATSTKTQGLFRKPLDKKSFFNVYSARGHPYSQFKRDKPPFLILR